MKQSGFSVAPNVFELREHFARVEGVICAHNIYCVRVILLQHVSAGMGYRLVKQITKKEKV
jgi:hypothetical protein